MGGDILGLLKMQILTNALPTLLAPGQEGPAMPRWFALARCLVVEEVVQEYAGGWKGQKMLQVDVLKLPSLGEHHTLNFPAFSSGIKEWFCSFSRKRLRWNRTLGGTQVVTMLFVGRKNLTDLTRGKSTGLVD